MDEIIDQFFIIAQNGNTNQYLKIGDGKFSNCYSYLDNLVFLVTYETSNPKSDNCALFDKVLSLSALMTLSNQKLVKAVCFENNHLFVLMDNLEMVRGFCKINQHCDSFNLYFTYAHFFALKFGIRVKRKRYYFDDNWNNFCKIENQIYNFDPFFLSYNKNSLDKKIVLERFCKYWAIPYKIED